MKALVIVLTTLLAAQVAQALDRCRGLVRLSDADLALARHPIPAEKLALIGEATRRACDDLDGLEKGAEDAGGWERWLIRGPDGGPPFNEQFLVSGLRRITGDPELDPMAFDLEEHWQLIAEESHRADVLDTDLAPFRNRGGGPGPDQADFLSALIEWVENGTAPERIRAEQRGADGELLRARPVCAHPREPVYTGGDPDAAASFECR